MFSKIKSKLNGRIIALLVLAAVLLASVITAVVYISDYYRADEDAIAAICADADIPERTLKDGTVVVGDENAEIGIIFYNDYRI